MSNSKKITATGTITGEKKSDLCKHHSHNWVIACLELIYSPA